MMTRTCFAMMFVVCPLVASAQETRVQTVGERTYFAVRIKSPDDLRIPRVQRQSLDKIAIHDLGRYPRLVPQDPSARNIAWHFSTDTKALEFVGIAQDQKTANFLLLYPTDSGDKWKETPLTIDLASAAKADDLPTRWAAAWAREFAVRERLAGDAPELRFARQELCRKYKVADPLPRPAPPRDAGERTVDIREIREIEPAEHPWDKLLAGREPQIEPLVRVVPADFYYFRVRTAAGVTLLDQFQRWAALGFGVWDGAGHDYQLRDRYWRQLALPAGWPKQVRETALIGSDLHFRLGTDVTLLFLTEDANAFRQEIDVARGNVKEERSEHEGVAIRSYVGGDVRVQWAEIGGLVVCSNSPAAIRRVIDVVRRGAPSVADTPEFRLTRSLFPPASPAEDVLAFFTETFLRAQFGPRHRILLRRRMIEEDERRAARAATLLQAWDTGKPPVGPDAVPALPLIERSIDKITKSEDEFYQEYREHYRNELADYVAPVALRFQARPNGMRAEAYIMAPRSADFWDAVASKLGKGAVAREATEPAGTAARAVFSYTPGELDRARLKNWLIAKGVNKKHLGANIEWMGNRLAFNLSDGKALANLVEHMLHTDLTADDLSKSRGDMTRRWLLTQLPATLAVEVAKPLIFQGWVKKVKEIVEETWPKMFTWEALPEEYRRVKMTGVKLNPGASLFVFGKLLKAEEMPGVFFAPDGRTLVLAPGLETLKAGIAREMIAAPREARERANGWLTLNLGAATELQGYLRSYAEREAHRQALAAATLRQGRPAGGRVDTAAPRLRGCVPAAPDRSVFRRDASRGEVVNDRHGSPRSPRLNEPATDSPWLRTLADFAHVRGELHVRPDGLLGVLLIEK